MWQTVRDHLYHLCVQAQDFCFLVERAVVGLLRLAIRLLRREEISGQVSRVQLGGQEGGWGVPRTEDSGPKGQLQVCLHLLFLNILFGSEITASKTQ